MNPEDKWLKKELENVSKEQEDRAWSEKHAEYGDKFKASKFYELDSLKSKVISILWLIVIFGLIGWLAFKQYEVLVKK